MNAIEWYGYNIRKMIHLNQNLQLIIVPKRHDNVYVRCYVSISFNSGSLLYVCLCVCVLCISFHWCTRGSFAIIQFNRLVHHFSILCMTFDQIFHCFVGCNLISMDFMRNIIPLVDKYEWFEWMWQITFTSIRQNDKI